MTVHAALLQIHRAYMSIQTHATHTTVRDLD